MKSDDKRVEAPAVAPAADSVPTEVWLYAMLREMIGTIEGLADQVPGGHSITARITRLKDELERISAGDR